MVPSRGPITVHRIENGVANQPEKNQRNPTISDTFKSDGCDGSDRSEGKGKGPNKTDDAPRSFVLHDAIGHQRTYAINRQVTKQDGFELESEQTDQQACQNREFIMTN